MPTTIRSSAIVLLLSVLSGAAFAASTGVYKWVDERGMVHYSGQPPESMEKGATVLDKQGRSIKKLDPPMSAEQRKTNEAEERRKRQLERDQAEQARKDRALMQSYSSEAEIDVARNRAAATLESQINSAQTYSAELGRRQKELETQRHGYGSKAIPIALERELASIADELQQQSQLIEQKREDLASVRARYDAEKERWRSIIANQERATSAASGPSAMTSGATPVRAQSGTTAAK